jgi:hypothetical protein
VIIKNWSAIAAAPNLIKKGKVMQMTSTNNLSQVGADKLKRKLEGYWRNLSSAAAVNFWIESQGTEQHPVWCVRSSLRNGLPGPLLTSASTSNTTGVL